MECLRDCNADCCQRGASFSHLTSKQLRIFEQAGARFEPICDDQTIGITMTTACPFLEGNRCGLKDKVGRPWECDVLQPGSPECLKIRGIVARRRQM